MAKANVGIFIGKNFIDIVNITGAFNNPRIITWLRKDIRISPQEPPTSPEELDKKIAHITGAAIRELSAPPDKIFIVLPESRIIIRHFDMPLLPKAEQAAAIKFEARKYIPFKIEDVVSNFKIVSVSKVNRLMRVFFAAAQKIDIESQIKLFQNSGVKIDGIDIAPSALFRVLNINKKYFKEDEVTALLHLNTVEGIAGINIIEANYPAISRDIPISQNTDMLTDRLISELRLSFDYYKRKPLSKNINKLTMVICGSNELGGLDKKLSEELNISIERVDTSALIKDTKFESVGAIIAAGAAMNGLGRDIYGVNLLPKYAKSYEYKGPSRSNVVITTAMVAVALTLLYCFGIVSSAKSKYKIALDKATTLPASTQGMPIEALNTLKNQTQGSLSFIESLLTNRTYITEKLERIAANLPEGAWITSLEVKNPADSNITLTLHGKAFLTDASQQVDMVNKFLGALKQDEIFMQGFDTCELADLSKDIIDSYEVTSYSIICSSRGK